MNILIASDSFKGSLTSLEVGGCLKNGILSSSSNHQVSIVPIADGGEGTLDAISYTNQVVVHQELVSGPLDKQVEAKWLFIPNLKTAVVESAQAIGLPLLDENEKNPLKTHTKGLGMLIRSCIENGATTIIVGLGGSSTNDGGTAMLSELGMSFHDSNRDEIVSGNQGLKQLRTIENENLITNSKPVKFVVACDVDNPLTGEKGATYTYGAQKGADEDMLMIMESNMENFRKVMIKQGFGDPNDTAGAGAAGGLGGAFSQFLDGELRSGFDIIKDLNHLEDEIKKADLVITGEGRLDSQSLHGKVPIKVAELCRQYGKPVIVVSGKIEAGEEITHIFDGSYDIVSRSGSVEEGIKNACKYLTEIGVELHRDYLSR